jgi:NADPH:quinone reductase-like Zn-dependent oxidoreductase
MKAAIVNSFEKPPYYGDIDSPTPRNGEVLVQTQAAAISQLVRVQAAGKHYSIGKTLPIVPGADGVGLLENGQRVFFAFPKPPIGSMAEVVAVKPELCVSIPDDVDNITAAAIGNPGMSSIAALEYRAHFKPGETVLINGAAGASGRLAIQISKYLGASRVVATARNPHVESELLELGADKFILLKDNIDELTASFQIEMQNHDINIVLDYLWGQPAECLLKAAANVVTEPNRPRIRFVNIGASAGMSMPISASVLRSTGLELTGSGLGSISNQNLIHCIGKLLEITNPAGLKIDTLSAPIQDIEQVWKTNTKKRIVLTV